MATSMSSPHTLFPLPTLLDSGRLASVSLVKKYHAQIEWHNIAGMVVRALVYVAPRAGLLKQALSNGKSAASEAPCMVYQWL